MLYDVKCLEYVKLEKISYSLSYMKCDREVI